MYNSITICREFGSLGRYIARIVAKEMNYEYYDRDNITKLVKNNFNINEVENEQMRMSEYYRMEYPLGSGSPLNQERLFEAEKSVIIDLASSRNCVIVGRCSDYILKENNCANIFSVFIYAPIVQRYYFSMNNFGLTSDAVISFIERVDRERQHYYHRFTGEDFTSCKYRDLMLDSSFADKETIAKIICESANAKFCRAER